MLALARRPITSAPLGCHSVYLCCYNASSVPLAETRSFSSEIDSSHAEPKPYSADNPTLLATAHAAVHFASCNTAFFRYRNRLKGAITLSTNSEHVINELRNTVSPHLLVVVNTQKEAAAVDDGPHLHPTMQCHKYFRHTVIGPHCPSCYPLDTSAETR